MARLFVGIELDERARAACERAMDALRRAAFDAKYEAAEKLHVTLAFLGNVDDARRDDAIAAASRAASGVAPFEVAFDKYGAFPNERRPRIVYAGSREQGAPFRELVAATRGGLDALGFPFDQKDTVAHVTLARTRLSRRPLPQLELPPFTLAIAELVLFDSIFDAAANATRYEAVARMPLGSQAR